MTNNHYDWTDTMVDHATETLEQQIYSPLRTTRLPDCDSDIAVHCFGIIRTQGKAYTTREGWSCIGGPARPASRHPVSKLHPLH